MKKVEKYKLKKRLMIMKLKNTNFTNKEVLFQKTI